MLLAGVCCLSCPAQEASPQRGQRRLALSTDSRAEDLSAAACLAIPPEGCCDGEALWWCEDGALQSLSCADRSFCGWSSAGFFDCNTSGQSDPSGRLLKSCKRLLGDAGPLPALDSGLPDSAGDPCQGIPKEGCCTGEVLRFCQGGALQQIDCRLNTSCGWQPNGQYYDCGTTGSADPQGRFPLQCPGPLPDARIDASRDSSTDGRDGLDGRAGDGGDGGKKKGGCACHLGGSGSLGEASPLGLLLLLWLGLRWRRA